MGLAEVVALILFLAIIAYAVFGGADFGSGVWDLTAGDAADGGDKRRLIDQAIGPVWEANHVWLIFVLVFLLTGFPAAFASISSTLYVPLSLAALGIVFRGAGFAFRKASGSIAEARVHGAMFAVASLVTPFFFGAAAGAVASGRVPAEGVGDRWTSWLGPTSLLGGVLAVLTCAFLASTFLAAEAEAINRRDLALWFGTRAFWSGVITGAVALVGVVPLSSDAPTLSDGLLGRGLWLVATSAIAGLCALALLRSHRWALARIAAAAAVVSVIGGWGLGQYPWLLVDEVEISVAAAGDATLWALVVTAAIALVTVVPSLIYLFILAGGHRLASEKTEVVPAGDSRER